MALENRYVLDVDLKRQATARIPKFRREDNGVLIFRIFNDGVEYNINSATKAILYQRTPSGVNLESECVFTTLDGKRVIRYDYEKIAMVELGYNTLVLVVYENSTVVSIQPFHVIISDDLKGGSGSYIELIQDLMKIIESLRLDLENTIKLSEKGQPNGVATLDKDGKIPLLQMPKEVDSFMKHMLETIYEHMVHGMRVNEDGILQYDTPNGWQNVGFAPDATGDGGNNNAILHATVSVVNGTATVTYTGSPSLVQEKWTTGDREIPYFNTGGTLFTGHTFEVSSIGMHTLWYKDSNGNTYVVKFNVTVDMLPQPKINVKVEDGLVTVDIDKPVSIKKWSSGRRDISYFQYNGTVFTGNSFQVTEVGTYTIYIKTSAGAEYVYVFEVTESMLPIKDTEPPSLSHTISYGANNATITVVATDSGSGVDYILKPDNIKASSSTTTYTVYANGTYRFYTFDKAGNSSYIDVLVNNITLSVPTIALNSSPTAYTNGNVTITAYISSTIANGTIVTRKWASGNRAISYFATSGTTYTGNTFTVSENGTYTIYAKDSYGAESVKTISIINIDKVAPSITLSYSPTSYTNGNVTILTSISDSGSGMNSAKYANGNRAVSYFTSSGTNLPSSDSFTVNANGTYTIYAKDNAGNATVQTITINNISTTSPTISLSQSPTSWTNGNVTISANIASSITLSSIKWASGNQNASYFNSSGTTFSNSFSISNNGTYTVYVKDSAGNAVVKTISVTNIDKTPPTISVSTTNTSVSASISDSQSGINTKKYASGNRAISYFTSSGTSFTGSTFTVSSSGTYTVYAKDNAGNASVQTFSVSGDTNAPTITLEASPTMFGETIVTIDLQDESTITELKYASGNQSISYFSSGGGYYLDYEFFKTSNAGTYTVYAKDSSGNESVKAINVTIATSTDNFGMPLWTGYGGDYTKSSTINDNNKTSAYDKIVFWYSPDDKPTPLSFFRNGYGIYPYASSTPNVYTNYSNLFQYKIEATTSSWQIQHRISVKYTSLSYGYFTTYIKLKSGKEFISYGSVNNY